VAVGSVGAGVAVGLGVELAGLDRPGVRLAAPERSEGEVVPALAGVWVGWLVLGRVTAVTVGVKVVLSTTGCASSRQAASSMTINTKLINITNRLIISNHFL
jgi:hypothetical protein